MAQLLKTEIYNGLTIVGDVDIFLNKNDFSSEDGVTVYLMDNKTKLINKDVIYKLKYRITDNEARDVVDGNSWYLWKESEPDSYLNKTNVTIEYKNSIYTYGEYTLQNGNTVTTWKGSLQGGGGASSPESIIFTEDITLTEPFGKYNKNYTDSYCSPNKVGDSNASYTIKTATMSLKDLILNAFNKTSIGTVPSVTLTTSFKYSTNGTDYSSSIENNEVKVGTTVYIKLESRSASVGTYTYGGTPDLNYTYNQENNSVNSETLGFGESLKTTVTASWNDTSTTVVQNNGQNTTVTFPGNTKTSYSDTIKSYAYIKYKQFNNVISNLRDENLTSLSEYTNRKIYSSSTAKFNPEITFTEGRKDFVILVPKGWGVTNIECRSKQNVEYILNKRTNPIKIDTIDYDIYHYNSGSNVGSQTGSVIYDFIIK